MGLDVIGRESPRRRSLGGGVRWRPGERPLAAASAVIATASVFVLATGSIAPGTRGTAGGGDAADAPGVAVSRALGPPPRPDLAVRPIGGTTVRSAAGARGSVDLEVRNAERPVELLSITAEVPGVAFTVAIPPNGTVLGTDGRVALRLDYDIAECARLRRTGRLVLRVTDDGRPAELGLTITNDAEAGTLRQAVLDRVLHACD